ncbi:MAG: pyridoxal 5'-phosphate synthase glutaminase subunit PdxT [Lentisphaeria bacterium]|nr:pyridoxal 5'-phosphate synthase glutaminase subunit PdxT [Lentisphaeria bacterium]
MSDESEPIGILALQGGVIEHRRHIEALGLRGRDVRYARDLDGLAGLILPGGESTCLGRLLRMTGLDRSILAAHRERRLPLWGTCAGAILLATEIAGESPHLGLVDMTVQRNAFGSQLESFRRRAQIPAVSREPVPLVFIRAPRIVRVGPSVRVLLALDGYVAAVESGGCVLATVFHPELSSSLAFHRYFAGLCGLAVPDSAPWSREPFLGLRQAV